MPFDPVVLLKGISKESLGLEIHGYHENVYQTIIYKGTKLEITQVFNTGEGVNKL